ncbi:putative Histone-lysine N-methyltransferase SETMAR [Hypsibius exemplaris]|uniref:Histone-lysine N-methyltransferase SETMAR n=1 Tax=Hypsibius exemplaris TaxID=2072580 RepID=A0A9X6NAS9_HYPEX|nr:putative Histone-lysine N-methyltransferase SETMAR [Hypsibius exemplaris]
MKTILKRELGLKKICSRWVPHRLTADQNKARLVFAQNLINGFGAEDERRLHEIVTGDEMWGYYYDPLTKRQSMEWVKREDPRPTKVRRSKSVKKTMFIIFFNSAGVVSTSKLVSIPGRRTINARFYVNSCFKKLVWKLKKKRGKTGLRGLKLHHDNASSHTCGLTVKFLNQENLKTLPHPPYSPDLSPCDFYLFPKLKESLRGKLFETEEALDAAVHARLRELSKDGFSPVFESWLDRCRKCIEFEGDYFEER